MEEDKEAKIKKKIDNDEDFIYCPRLGNSLKKLLEKNPDGVPDSRITKVLLISQKTLNNIYESAIKKLRSSIKLIKD